MTIKSIFSTGDNEVAVNSDNQLFKLTIPSYESVFGKSPELLETPYHDVWRSLSKDKLRLLPLKLPTLDHKSLSPEYFREYAFELEKHEGEIINHQKMQDLVDLFNSAIDETYKDFLKEVSGFNKLNHETRLKVLSFLKKDENFDWLHSPQLLFNVVELLNS